MDSGIPATTRGIECMGKTNSVPMGPRSSGDGMGEDKGISSFAYFFHLRDRGCRNILLVDKTKGSL